MAHADAPLREYVAAPYPGNVQMNDTANNHDSNQIGRLVYFAAERTLMSWIRTALGLMALGVVVDRIGALSTSAPVTARPDSLPSLTIVWEGTVLVLLGAAMAFLAAVRFVRFSFHYHRDGDTNPRHGILMGAILILAIASAGILLAFFLATALD